MKPVSNRTRDALIASKAWITTYSVSGHLMTPNAPADEVKFDRGVEALIAVVTYEARRRQRGIPQWSKPQWAKFNAQSSLVGKILPFHRSILASALECHEITPGDIRKFMRYHYLFTGVRENSCLILR